MKHFKIILLCFFLSWHPIVEGAIDCVSNEDVMFIYNWCIFKGISTTETHPFFEPSYRNRWQVERITFDNSTIPILTSEICETFPNLLHLELRGCSLNRIQDRALSCDKLEFFSIEGNVVTEINPNLLWYKPNLKTIDFSNNKLTYIDVKMFESTKNLVHLELSNNNLFHLDIAGIPNLENLRQLYINNNNLLDLDETALVTKFPNLRILGLEGNLFQCQNLETMLKVIGERNIKLEPLLIFRRTRLLVHSRSAINNVDCFDRDFHSKVVSFEILKIIKYE